MKRFPTCIAVIGAALALSGPMAHAAPIAIDATDRGWYDVTGFHGSSNLNYVVGDLRDPVFIAPEDAHHRNFFVFDLTGVPAGQIGGATLRLFNPGAPDLGFGTDLASETYNVHDVSTAIATLVAGGTDLGIWIDLGSGTSYGTYVATPADNGTFVEITLNAAAVTALNAGAGGLFAFGGALTTLNGVADAEHLFGFSNDDVLSDTQLLLDVGDIPEPGTLALFGLGLASLGFARRRKAA